MGRRYRRQNSALWAFAALAVVGGGACAVDTPPIRVDHHVVNPNFTVRARTPQDVQVFFTQKPPRSYQLIAVVEAVGTNAKDDAIVARLREEAARIGADAIVNIQKKQQMATIADFGAAQTALQITLTGMAVQWR